MAAKCLAVVRSAVVVLAVARLLLRIPIRTIVSSLPLPKSYPVSGHEVAQSPGDTVSELAWSPAANILAAASWDKQVRIWEVTTQASTSAFGGSSGSNSIQATPKLA